MLSEGGRFRLAPLYDVMSAEPYAASMQMDRKKLKLAMAVGDGRHYEIESIVPRHFRQTARACGFAEADIDAILHEVAKAVPTAIDNVTAELPPTVMVRIVDLVMEALRRRSGMLG